MRLNRLRLLAFGPFTGLDLDLRHGDPGGLHVIFGPNEAGKSTALRAVSDFFFGIPQQTGDAHVHPMNRLAIGAELLLDGGRLVNWTRTKRKKDSLVTADDRPVSEEELAQNLGFIDQSSFRRRFGLDQDELEHGAEALLGRGEAGLFSAGTAGSQVQRELVRLEQEAAERFSPRGRVKPVNQAAERYKESLRAQASLTKTADAWSESEEERTRIRRELERVSQARRAARIESERLHVLASVHAQLADLELVQEELRDLRAQLPQGTMLTVESRERRILGERQRTEAWVRVEQERRELGLLGVELAREERELGEQEGRLFLPWAEEVHGLKEPLGSARNARGALPRLISRFQAALGQVARAIQSARVTAAGLDAALAGRAERDFLECARGLVVPAPAAARLRALQVEQGRLETEFAIAHKEWQEAQALTLADESDAGKGQTEGGDWGLLGAALADAETSVAQASRAEQCRERGVQLERELRQLVGQVAAEPGSIVRSRLPLEAELEAGGRAFEKLEAEASQLEVRLRGLGEERERLEAEYGALAQGTRMTSEKELQALRDLRNSVIQRVVAELSEGEAEKVRGDLLEASHAVDGVADTLRHSAEVLARGEEIQRRLEALGRDAEKAEARRREILERIQQSTERLFGRLGDAGYQEGRGERDWVAGIALSRVLFRQAETHEELTMTRGELGAHEGTAIAAGRALSQALGRQQEPPALAGPPVFAWLNRLVEAGRAEKKRLETEEREARNRKAERERAQSVLARAEAQITQIDQRRKKFGVALAEQLGALGWPPGLSLEAACDRLAALDLVVAPLTEAGQHLQRIEGIERDAEQLGSQIRELIARAGWKEGEGDALELADRMHALLTEAERRRTVVQHLQLEQAERREKLAEAERTHEREEAALAQLYAEVQAPDRDTLLAWEGFSERARAAEAKERALLSYIEERADGRTLAALRAEAAALDYGALRAKLTELTEAMERLDAQVSEYEGQLRALDLELERYRTADAARARQEAEIRLAEGKRALRDYLRRRVAHELLSEEAKRSAERFVGPLTERAGTLFSRMTLGVFQGIDVGLGDQGVRCVRGGAKVEVHELSRGTRAQLYLALRLASLEGYFGHHPKIPVVLDDLFVDFDDDRASAAFEVLGEFAQQVQVLYFTHLSRDVERASDAVSGRILKLHRLSATAG